jgi:hypothetical protein
MGWWGSFSLYLTCLSSLTPLRSFPESCLSLLIFSQFLSVLLSLFHSLSVLVCLSLPLDIFLSFLPCVSICVTVLFPFFSVCLSLLLPSNLYTDTWVFWEMLVRKVVDTCQNDYHQENKQQGWRLGEKGVLIHCWWECESVRPVWKSVWSFLKS